MENSFNQGFHEQIRPFFVSEYNGTYSLCLDVGGYLDDVFDTRAEEGFEGNGYDWGALALVFLNERCSQLKNDIKFDSEAGMFCVYTKNKEALEQFALAFKAACGDKALILDLFSRAELD